MPDVKWIEPRWNVQIGYRSLSENNAPRAPVVMGVSPRVVPETHEPIMPKLVTDRDLAGIRLTNPEREMFEGTGATKLDIALYYARVGDWMLPELMRRPVSLIRCPTGALKDCFYQRHAFHGLPEGVEKIDLADEDEERAAYIYVSEPKGFLALAQFGAIEFHPWGCKVDDPEHPDRIVMDLDPAPDVGWPQVCGAAELLRDKLKSLGFEPFLRTTGGKGLHLVMALEGGHTWPIVKGFAEAFARSCAKDWPDVFTAVASKEKRKGRIYVDYLRNGRGASAVASYSLRANVNLTVATPITWKELRDLPGGNAFDRKTVLRRLDKLAADPWDELSSSKTTITQKMRRDVGMDASRN